ncbi:MAG: DUF4743 domain-containing protein [Alphaproteobacteria bacterium]|nr:DUF4743 domain-containing protein [Alphaproteobacteria bacterium]
MSPTGYVRHFEQCHRHDLNHFAPFGIGSTAYGHVKKEHAAFLLERTKLFEPENGGLALSSRYKDFASRSAALTEATLALAEKTGKSLRDELYPIVRAYGDEPVAQIDRAAVPWFGVRAWGLHVNGFVRKANGIHLWIGKRAANRQVEPGKLDNMIGGGNPIGISIEENLCKEAKEEAGIDAPLALTAKLVREINYKLELPDGLRTDTLFLYDLELPESFVPRNTDGEVASFTLMPLAQAAELVKNTNDFKFNCGMVLIDFLVRHNFVGAQDPEYGQLKEWLKK